MLFFSEGNIPRGERFRPFLKSVQSHLVETHLGKWPLSSRPSIRVLSTSAFDVLRDFVEGKPDLVGKILRRGMMEACVAH